MTCAKINCLATHQSNFETVKTGLAINRATYYSIRKQSYQYFKLVFRNMLFLQYFKLNTQSTSCDNHSELKKRRINLTAVADKSKTERKCLIYNIL